MPDKDEDKVQAEKADVSKKAFDENRSRLAQVFERQRQDREKLNQLEAQARSDARAGHYADLNELSQKAWHDVMDMAKEFYYNRQQGYDSFQSAMSSLFVFNMRLGDAIRAQAPILLGRVFDVGSFASSGLLQVGEAIGQKVGVLTDPSKPVEVDYYIDFDKRSGCVGVRHLARVDGEPITPEQQQSFEADVVAWLKLNQYDANAAVPGGFIHRETKASLDAFTFDKIRDNFKDYLSHGYAIRATLNAAFHDEPTRRPRP